MRTIAKGPIWGVLAPAIPQSPPQENKVAQVDSAKATFRQLRPGVSKVMLWGDDTKGPYGAFTKFEPGLNNPLHTHTNDIRLVVLKGAYIYKPENGEERRGGARPELFFPPGGPPARHRGPTEGGR